LAARHRGEERGDDEKGTRALTREHAHTQLRL
jgi:hypothetical protein